MTTNTKINFPLKTELATVGGHRAVVLEWLEGYGYGRYFDTEDGQWYACRWDERGICVSGPVRFNLIPPKPKYRLLISASGLNARWIVPGECHLAQATIIEIEAPDPEWAIT